MCIYEHIMNQDDNICVFTIFEQYLAHTAIANSVTSSFLSPLGPVNLTGQQFIEIAKSIALVCGVWCGVCACLCVFVCGWVCKGGDDFVQKLGA